MAIFNQYGATTLPYTCQDSYGKFKGWRNSYNHNDPTDLADVDGTFVIRLFSTSDVSTALANTWASLAEQTFTAQYFSPRPGEEVGRFTIEFNQPRFNGAKSFAIQVSTPTGSYVHTNVGVDYLYYATAAISVLDSGESMGQFFYFATDGGSIG